jgi:hypothetical protein
MNWALFAFGASSVLLLCWAWTLLRARRSWASIYVSLGFLILAGMNSAAPVRGLVDPDYVGYGFGLLRADKGISVTLVAGAVFVASVACLIIAANNRPGRRMWLVAGVSLAFLAVMGWPWLQGVVADPSKNAIQFGEYQTIPGAVASVLVGLLLVGPFVVGVPWAARRAMSVRPGPVTI